MMLGLMGIQGVLGKLDSEVLVVTVEKMVSKDHQGIKECVE